MSKRLFFIISVLLFVSAGAFAQVGGYSSTATDTTGKRLSLPTVKVCADALCATTATIYKDAAQTELSNPFTGDAQGNYSFYAAPGNYFVQVAKAGYGTLTTPANIGGDAAQTGNNAFTGSNTHSGTETFSGAALFKAGPIFDVKAFGAVGDGLTDDTAAIQAAINTGRHVWIPKGTYNFTALTMTTSGQFVTCEDPETTVLQSTSNTLNGITIATTVPAGFLYNGGIENCNITGTGKGVSSATGVQFGGASSSHNGDVGVLRNDRIRGWNINLETYSWGQMDVSDTFLQDCGDKCWWIHGGSSNSYNAVGLSAQNATNACVQMDSGVGAKFVTRDFGQCGPGFHIATGAQATIIGSNMESMTGTMLTVDLGGSATIQGARQLKGSVESSQISVDAGFVGYCNVTRSGFLTTTPLVTLTSSSAVVLNSCPSPVSLNGGNDPGGVEIFDSVSGETFRGAHFPVKPDNAIPTPVDYLRGGCYFVAARTVAAIDDKLMCYYRQNGGAFANIDLLHPTFQPGNLFFPTNATEQRNGASPQRMSWMNTYTDASNYERLSAFWGSSVAFLLTEQLGTGAARTLTVGTSGNASLKLRTNGTDRWFVNGAGDFLGQTTNTNNIGNGTNDPAKVYADSGHFIGANVSWTSAAGAPAAGTCTTTKGGSLYSRTDGTTTTTLYVCDGSTGVWTAK